MSLTKVLIKFVSPSAAGNVISALQQTGKSLAYITVGQKVTSGIESAKSERVLEFLEGFDAV